MRSSLPLVCTLSILGSTAETVKDRAGAVRDDRSKMENNTRWIYNDWQRGFAEASQTGKPLMIVLRCVPCLACMGIDASVLSDPDLTPLLDQFVKVRVINANALDLSLFQFDYDLSFSTLFFNGDKTVYGRFGSWTHQKNPGEKDTAALQQALEGTLALHRGYPANKASLVGKQPRPVPVTDPLALPELAGKYKRELDWDGKVVQSCVHCHQIGDAIRVSYHDKKEKIPREWIYPMPMPETLGLKLAPDQAAQIEAVTENSVAAKGGFKAGDVLISLNGQPLLSGADVSWVLHHAPASGTLRAVVRRQNAEQPLSIELSQDWRLKSDISRRVGTWELRAMALGGLWLEDLPADQKRARELPATGMALLVKHAGEYGKHAAAKKAGFRKDDILVAVDGISDQISESEIIGRILGQHAEGDRLPVTVLRDRERLDLALPVQ